MVNRDIEEIRTDRLDSRIHLSYDIASINVKGTMLRKKAKKPYPLLIVLIAAVVLSLPFVHLHPRLSHADDLGEHSHAGVIHTIFSSDSPSNPSSSVDGLNSGYSVELSRTAINLNLFSQRLLTETISKVLPAVWTSSDFFVSSPISIYTSLTRSNVLSPHSSWMGSLPFLRGPPFLAFS